MGLGFERLPDAAAEGDPVAIVRLAQYQGVQGIDVEELLEAEAAKYEHSTELQARATVTEVQALVALARGDFARALERAQASFRLLFAPDGSALHTATRAAAWVGDLEALAEALGVFQEQPGRVMAAGARRRRRRWPPWRAGAGRR